MEVESNLHLFLFQINHATLFFYFKQKKLNLYTILRNEVILSSVMLSCGRPGTDRRSFPSGYLIHPLAPIAPLQKNLSTNSAPTVVALSTTALDLHAGLHHATAPPSLLRAPPRRSPAPRHPRRRDRLRCPLSYRASAHQGCVGLGYRAGARADARPGCLRTLRRCSPRPPSRFLPKGRSGELHAPPPTSAPVSSSAICPSIKVTLRDENTCCKSMFQVFQLFYMHVASVLCGYCKSRLGLAYVAMVVHICCKLLFSMFQLFLQTYLASVFVWMFNMFYTYVASVFI
jgi:hypothetical protein